MPLFEDLEIYGELKRNMQILDRENVQNSDKKDAYAESAEYENALENFLDAYLQYYQKNKQQIPDWVAQDVKSKFLPLKLSASQNNDLSLQVQTLKDLLASPELSSLQSKPLREDIESFLKNVELERQLDERLSQLSNSQPASLIGLEKLIKDANKQASKEKKEVSRQKSEKNKHEKLKNVIVESLRARLEKKADKTEDEQYIAAHLDELVQAEMVDKKGYKYLRAVFPGNRSFDLRFWNYKNKNGYIFSPDNTKDKSKVTEIYELTEAGETLTFQSAAPQEKKKKNTAVKDKDFRKLLSVPQLSEKQEEEFSQELKAYNVYLSSGQQDKAEQLLSLLTEKYNVLGQKEKKEKYQEKKVQLQKLQTQRIAGINKHLNENMEALPVEEIFNLLAPGRGNNKKEESRRRKFNELLNVCFSDKKSAARNSRIGIALQKDNALWENVKENYYKDIKRKSGENYYQERVAEIFSGKRTLNQVLSEEKAHLPEDVNKRILLRGIELYALTNDTVDNHEQMNEQLRKIGHRIRFQEFTVAEDRQLKSKPLTAMLRCLADGKELNFSEQGGLDNRDKKYIQEHYDEFKKKLGKEPNFQRLIGDVIEGRDNNSPLALTPYQKRYKTLGLMTALALNTRPVADVLKDKTLGAMTDFVLIKENKGFENEIFSQATNTPNNTMIEAQKQKMGWNADDYLFKTYLGLFFEKDAALLSSEKLPELKEKYKWEEFKSKNQKASQQLLQEFSKNAPNPEKTVARLLVKGEMPGATVHHINPLKYAVSSENPGEYNNSDKLAISMQWNAWEDDNHQMEHLTTIEGIDAGNPYLVKTENGYVRRAQCDLRKGDVICYEKPQVLVGGKFQDFIPEKTLFLSSSGLIIASPEIPEIEVSGRQMNNMLNRTGIERE